jgi:hypothetical protein
MILDSMRPAARAFITISSHNAHASTDSAGRYRLVVPAQRIVDGVVVEITASRVGLNPERRQIPLAAGNEVVVDFSVKTSMFSDQRPCHGMIAGVTGPVRHPPIVYEKLCRLAGVHGARGPRVQRPPP